MLPLICLIAVVSTALCLFLWFRDVRRIMKEQRSTVESARRQLASSRERTAKARDDPDAAAVLERSENIYRQAVNNYGTTNNVRVSSSKLITVAGPLTGDARIGVTTSSTPDVNNSVAIAQGKNGTYTIESSDAAHFFADNSLYEPAFLEDEYKVVLKPAHQHNWEYESNGSKITARCSAGDCTDPTYFESLTISADDADYNGSEKAATLSEQSGLKSGLKDAAITYKQGETVLSSAPTNAGTYTASITVGGQTASVEYTIDKVDGSITTAPTANTLTYTGNGQALVTAGAGTGTMWYSLDNTNWSTVIPTGTNAVSYTVYYKLVGDVNHNDVAGGSVDVTIDKADPTVTAPTAKTLTYTGSAQELVNAGSTNSGTMEYKVGSDGDWTDTVPTGTNAGDYNVYYKVVGNDNYNDAAENGPAAVTISKATPGGSNAAKYIRYNDTAEKTFTAADFDLNLAGTFAPNGVVTDSGSVLASAPTYGSGIKIQLKGGLSLGSPVQTVTIPMTFTPSNTNYAAKDFTLTITLTAKENQAALTLTPSSATVIYGQTLTLDATGGTTNGTVTYSVTGGTGTATIADNVLTATGVGTVTVTATMAGNDVYNDVTSAPVEITITPMEITAPAADTTVFTYNGAAQTYTLAENAAYTVSGNVQTNAGTYNVTVALADTTNTKWNDNTTADKTYTFTIVKATPTGTPSYTAITASGKTLGDAELAVGTITPAGAIAWDQASSTAVSANTAYSWTFTPSDTANYNTLTGSITPYVVSYSGGYTPPTYKVESEAAEDADGSVSASVDSAKKGDTVTITVTPDRYYKVDGVTVKDSSGNEIAVTDNEDGTFTFQMPASKVTVEAIFSWDNPFTDVAEDAYYAPAVEWALKNSVTNGTGDGTTFSPNAGCTRAQIVTFLWQAAGCPEPASINSFTDVSADAYYAKAVAWAVEQGITGGTGDGIFSPDEICTRSQGVTFLYRAAGSPKVTDNIAFGDVAAGSYYADAVAWAAQNGVTGGTGNGKFSPGADCTRAQIVTFLYRWLVK